MNLRSKAPAVNAAIPAFLREAFSEERCRAPPTAPTPYLDERGVVRQCSNCLRVQRTSDGGWDFVGSLATDPPPNVSHGICPTCVDYYWGARLRAPRR